MKTELPTPTEQLLKLTEVFLDMARKCEASEPDKAKAIREHVSAVMEHWGELNAALIRGYGRTLDNVSDVPTPL